MKKWMVYLAVDAQFRASVEADSQEEAWEKTLVKPDTWMIDSVDENNAEIIDIREIK